MPFMHGESKFIYNQAVELFSAAGIKSNINFEFKHKVIIGKFGRYLHRNEILGRESIDEK